MLQKTLLFVAGVFGVVIAIVPRQSDEGTDAQAAAEQTAVGVANERAADTSASNSWYSGDHTLTRAADGHFYANAAIDGASIRMMVDTGASIIALTADDADAAGVEWDPSQVRVIGRGASGDVYGVPARLDSVEIGGFKRDGIDAVVVPEGLDVSLLGQSYLSKIDSVNIADDTMVMSGH